MLTQEFVLATNQRKERLSSATRTESFTIHRSGNMHSTVKTLTRSFCISIYTIQIDSYGCNATKFIRVSGLCCTCNLRAFQKSTKCSQTAAWNIICFHSYFFLNIFVEAWELQTQTCTSYLEFDTLTVSLKPNFKLSCQNPY